MKTRLAFSAHFRLSVSLISFALIGAVPVAAQSSSASGRLDGYVTDPSGRAVAGVAVSARKPPPGKHPRSRRTIAVIFCSCIFPRTITTSP